MRRDIVDQVDEVRARRDCPSRVVGIGDEHDAGLRRDRAQHGLQIVAVIIGGHADQLCPEHLGDHGINGKAILRHDDLRAGPQ